MFISIRSSARSRAEADGADLAERESLVSGATQVTKIVMGTLASLVLLGFALRIEALSFYPLLLLFGLTPAAIAILLPSVVQRSIVVSVAITAVWGAAVLVADGVNVGSLLVMVLALGGFAVLVAVSVGQLVYAGVRLISDRAGIGRYLPLLGVQLAAMAFVVFALMNALPFRMAVEWNRGPLEVLVAEAVAGHQMAMPTKAGAIEVREITVDTATVTFQLDRDAAHSALVYSTRGEPGSADDGFSRLSGNWWLLDQVDQYDDD